MLSAISQLVAFIVGLSSAMWGILNYSASSRTSCSADPVSLGGIIFAAPPRLERRRAVVQTSAEVEEGGGGEGRLREREREKTED